MDLELKARSFIGQMGKGRDLEMKLFLDVQKKSILEEKSSVYVEGVAKG